MSKLNEVTERVRHGYILIGSTVGLMVAGLAPAILFGYSLFHALVSQAWDGRAAVVAGGALAITMEFVGGVSAHVAQHARNQTVKALGYFTLATYTLIGLGYMLFFEPNPTIQRTGIMAYLVAPLLYLAVALLSATLQQGKEREEGKQYTIGVRRDELVWQREQQAIKEQREHEERLLKLQLDAEVKKVKATAAPVLSVATQPQSNTAATKKGLMMQHWQPGMGATELARLTGVNKSTASRYINNGAMKHYQLGQGNQ
jgi:hypothetical protein